MVEAVKQNFPQREIADASYELQGEIDARPAHRRRRQRATPRATTTAADPARIDPALERKQIDRVQAVRARRDAAAVERALAALEAAAARRRQPDAAAARRARAHATEGEIVDALQDVFGNYTETPVF